jgi:hypothetical protein
MGKVARDYVWANSRRKGTELLVMLAIAEHADDQSGIAFPSISRIATYARISDRQAQRVIQKLGKDGDISVRWSSGRGNNNEYRIETERVTPKSHPLESEMVTSIRHHSPNLKGDISNVKGDISNLKGDISNVKGDIQMSSQPIEPIQPEEPGREERESKARVEAVLLDYEKTVKRQLSDLHHRTRLNWEILIENRLNEGWDERKLHLIFVGCSKDKWPERKKFNGIKDLLGNYDVMDRMINLAKVADEIGEKNGNGSDRKNSTPAKPSLADRAREYDDFYGTGGSGAKAGPR